MTWEEATDALLQHFKAEWEALHAAIPVHYPNAKPVTADSESGAWVRIRFLPAYSRRVAVGGQLRMQGGIAVVNTFVPLETADGLSVSYGRDLEAIWEDAHTNGLSGAIHLGAPDQIPGIPDPEIPMWRSGVTVPFTIDHAP